MKLTADLSEFVAAARRAPAPEPVQEAARLHLLDTLGVMVAGSREPVSRVIQAYVAESGSRPQCTLLGVPLKASPMLASLANGTAAHAVEYEDGHDEAGLHPSVCAIPAALATAERSGGSLGDVIDATVIGYEVACRLSRGCQSRRDWVELCWHFTSLCGAFGAVAAAAVIEGLTAEQVERAIGIATGMAAGHILAEQDGSDSKFLQAGWGAQIGVAAVDLARGGLTAPRATLERPGGFFDLYVGEYDPLAVLSGLGGSYEISKASIKPYPTCRFTHGVIDSILWLRGHCQIDPTDEVEVEVRLPRMAHLRVVEPILAKQSPSNPLVAKFSAPYAAAVALLRGNVELDDFRGRFPDSQSIDIAKRIRCVVDDSLSESLYAAEVRLQTSRGEFRRKTVHPRGSHHHPLRWDELEDKSRACLGLEDSDPGLAGLVSAVRSGTRTLSIAYLLEGWAGSAVERQGSSLSEG